MLEASPRIRSVRYFMRDIRKNVDPNLESFVWSDAMFVSLGGVVSKTTHSKTKTEARSTQISKTKHPNFENEVPKTRKRSTQNSKTKYPRSKTKTPKYRKRSTQISKTKTPNSRKRSTLDRKRSTHKLDNESNTVQIYSSCKCISAAALEARWEAMFWT